MLNFSFILWNKNHKEGVRHTALLTLQKVRRFHKISNKICLGSHFSESFWHIRMHQSMDILVSIFFRNMLFMGMISETVNPCHVLCLFITPENCVSLQDSVSPSTNHTSGRITSKNLTSAATEFWEWVYFIFFMYFYVKILRYIMQRTTDFKTSFMWQYLNKIGTDH